MDTVLQKGFPQEFGASIEDFFERYQRLFYTIINNMIKDVPRFDTNELFQEFFLHIAEDNFKRLWAFKKICPPKTYLIKILKNFIKDKKKAKPPSETSLSEIKKHNEGDEQEYDIPVREDPLGILLSEEESDVFQDVLKATFSQLSTREKLIFVLSYDHGMKPQEIEQRHSIIINEVYETKRKTKKILTRELHKRGIYKFDPENRPNKIRPSIKNTKRYWNQAKHLD